MDKLEQAGISPTQRLLAAATAVGGLVGAPFWWLDLPASFAWDLPFFASRMLAAAALAFGAGGIVALERRSRQAVSAYLWLTVVYLAPLAAAIVVLHLDRFDFAQPVTWGFFTIALGLPASILALARPSLAWPERDGKPGAAVLAMTIAGMVLLLWGLAMFAWPAAPVRAAFAWPGDPLTSRLIAAMLFTLGLAMAWAARDRAMTGFVAAFGGVYGLGVGAATGLQMLAGRPAPLLYAAVIVVAACCCLLQYVNRCATDGGHAAPAA
jgi:hypothetical protein